MRKMLLTTAVVFIGFILMSYIKVFTVSLLPFTLILLFFTQYCHCRINNMMRVIGNHLLCIFSGISIFFLSLFLLKLYHDYFSTTDSNRGRLFDMIIFFIYPMGIFLFYKFIFKLNYWTIFIGFMFSILLLIWRQSGGGYFFESVQNLVSSRYIIVHFTILIVLHFMFIYKGRNEYIITE